MMAIHFRETDKEYYLIVNKQELYQRARQLHFDSAVLLTDELMEEEDIRKIQESGKAVFLVFYDETGEQLFRNCDVLFDARINHRQFQLPKDWSCYSEEEIHSLEESVSNFPPIGLIEVILRDHGYIRDTDYTDRCGNCQAVLEPEDKYCARCGTKRGMGRFEPFFNPMTCAYGPFIKSVFHCKQCGHSWETYIWGEELNYCPECGEKAVVLDSRTEESFEEHFGQETEDTEHDDDWISVDDETQEEQNS